MVWWDFFGGGDGARMKKLIEDPNLASAIAHMQRTLARLDRIIGGGESDLSQTLENMRQISENLRDLTENAKRYPSGVLLGQRFELRRRGHEADADPGLDGERVDVGDVADAGQADHGDVEGLAPRRTR
mgnify:CR=1 FL=1